ncbi:P-loop NTPase fold protein [Pelomonas sp. BJYL3]|uniref:P-loop NTPase fold protein n=1 Tax=Pelomonas sp. BJYL3 TaxID=2976697 RepID=UPI0022B2C297|nr:P-loop NTPase fold protein [Pelomonas sp. BJYL3]
MVESEGQEPVTPAKDTTKGVESFIESSPHKIFPAAIESQSAVGVPTVQGGSDLDQDVASTKPQTAPVTSDLEIQHAVHGLNAGSASSIAPVAMQATFQPITGVLNAKEVGQDTMSAYGTAGPKPDEDPTSVLRPPSRGIFEVLDDHRLDSGLGAEDDRSRDNQTTAGAKTPIEALEATGASIVPGYSNDEPSSVNRVDSLDMTADATAFAQIAISKSSAPPLAVGIFGHWGSGKSFFMDLVHSQVTEIAKQARSEAPDSGSRREFHDKVIQIRFNAWHYAETNLWASLVGHIFQEMSDATGPEERSEIFGRLNTARHLTLEAAESLVQARKEHERTKKGLLKATEALALAKSKPVRTLNLYADLVASAFSDADSADLAGARVQLDEAAEELGIGKAIASTKALTAEGASLLRNGIQARDLIPAIVRNIGTPRTAAVYVAATIFVPFIAVGLVRLLGKYFAAPPQWLLEMLASGAALSGVFAFWVRQTAGPVLIAINKLKSAKKSIDAHIAKNLQRYEAAIVTNEANVAKAYADVESASDMLKASSSRLADMHEELNGQSAANRLIAFVRARAADGDYAKHLGIVSTIRRDFEQLSDLVSGLAVDSTQEDRQERETFRHQVDRILIDANDGGLLNDEERKSLEALVHGRKATKMPFERIVLYIDDVDRCPPAKVVEVLQAVHMLLAFRLFVVFVAVDVRWVESSLEQQYSGMLTASRATSPLTSASDYLEKIFQIPYWVPSITPESSRALIVARLHAPSDRSHIDHARLGEVKAERPSTNPETTVRPLKFVPAVFSTEEQELLQQLAGILDSPRKVIRFMNLARFLKARGQLGRDEESNRALLIRLALATGAPHQYSALQSVLTLMSVHQGAFWGELLTDEQRAQMPKIQAMLKACDDLGISKGPGLDFNIGAQWASRLSFSVPRQDTM